jgi:hypothetical protein
MPQLAEQLPNPGPTGALFELIASVRKETASGFTLIEPIGTGSQTPQECGRLAPRVDVELRPSGVTC